MYRYIKDDSNFYDLALELSEGNVKEVYLLTGSLQVKMIGNDEVFK